MKAKLISAQYVKKAQSVLMHLEGPGGEFRSQVHRDSIAKFGSRTEEEITAEMEIYVDIFTKIYKDKEIEVTADKE